MRIATIKRLREAADVHFQDDDILPAFALYWLAYEGLWSRSLVKILWLRGSSIKEAERFVRDYHDKDPINMLRIVANQYIKSVPFFTFVRRNYQLRNKFFHNAIENKRLMRFMCDAFRGLFQDPSLLFVDTDLKIAGSPVHVGNPLEDLRGKKRRARNVQPLNTLVDMTKLEKSPPIALDLDEQDVRSILKKQFIAPVKPLKAGVCVINHRKTQRGTKSPAPLTQEEIEKRNGVLASIKK